MLGHTGYYVVSADWDLSDKKSKTNIKWSRERALAIGRSQRLRHTVGVNNFFCKLGAEARRNPDAELVAWIAERHVGSCTYYGAHPDAEGRWREGRSEIRFFLEYDRGTENLDRLARKLIAYAGYRKQLRGEDDFVLLFCFESARREANVRRALREADAVLSIATASLEGHSGPHESPWLPIGNEGRKLRLAELVEPEPSERTAVDDYLDAWDDR